jgi:hypothetical protein
MENGRGDGERGDGREDKMDLCWTRGQTLVSRDGQTKTKSKKAKSKNKNRKID